MESLQINDVYVTIIFVLIGLLVLTNVFWIVVTQKLVNKLMSRNYGEYIQSKQVVKPEKKGRMDEDAEEPDEFVIRQAENANSLFGIG